MEEQGELSSSNLSEGLVVVEKAGGEEMVQVFMVVRCYSCGTFQVHQVKKINKWQCKVCNEKQSILKVYGKGAARDCRHHVQKLNMARGENERSLFGDDDREEGPPGVVVVERAGRERSTERERGEGVRGSYPPSDYANTFNTQNHSAKDAQSMHPVMLLAGKGSKWTTFIEPTEEDDDDDEDDSVYTTDRRGFSQASKNRRKARRSLSERKPHPPGSHDQAERVCPYSSVNQEFYDKQALEFATTGTASSYNLDRYTRLDTLCPSPSQQEESGTPGGRHSKSMFNLSAIPYDSPTDHKEQLSRIKQDLEQFSRQQQQQDHHSNQVATATPPPQQSNGDGSNTNGTMKTIPKISSRWSQFMCETDSDSDEGDSSLLVASRSPEGKRPPDHHAVHILASKSTISNFALLKDQ